MAKLIKNNDTIDRTWVGQLILVDEYYEIQNFQELAWANNSKLLEDIGNGKAIVAKDDSGNKDITDVYKAINHLKDDMPKLVQTLAVEDPNGKRARLVGMHSATAAANTTTDSDWLIPQLQFPAGTNTSSIFNGIQYYCKDSTMGDSLNFALVDKDGTGVTLGLYSQSTYDTYKDGNGVFTVEEFGKDWYVSPNSLEDIILYKAKLLVGLYIRSSYTNTHATNTVPFFCNLYRHLDI